ncbi:MAG: organic solvent tolerance protein [Bdellovibrionales bacterium]|nr:organic solvent tolerance protein [Bdellovibrionales bacterium]
MKTLLTTGLFSILLSAAFSTSCFAKELGNRLGVGYTDQFSEPMPSLALRYWPDPKLGFGADLGVDTQEDNAKFGFMVKLYRIIFTEDNLNFYMGTGAGLITLEVPNAANTSTSSDSGFELTGFCGGEFFFTGLENLGFSFEAGVGVTSIDSQVRFRTIGQGPMKAGIIFYF